jgi:hypothetical protein
LGSPRRLILADLPAGERFGEMALLEQAASGKRDGTDEMRASRAMKAQSTPPRGLAIHRRLESVEERHDVPHCGPVDRPHARGVAPHHDAEAVVLDLVQPVWAGRRGFGQASRFNLSYRQLLRWPSPSP